MPVNYCENACLRSSSRFTSISMVDYNIDTVSFWALTPKADLRAQSQYLSKGPLTKKNQIETNIEIKNPSVCHGSYLNLEL